MPAMGKAVGLIPSNKKEAEGRREEERKRGRGRRKKIEFWP